MKIVSFHLIYQASYLNFTFEFVGDINQPLVEDTKLSAVRLKLEEKRRHIEKEKRKIEAQMSKQLQKVGKAAFLQAINKRVRSCLSRISLEFNSMFVLLVFFKKYFQLN